MLRNRYGLTSDDIEEIKQIFAKFPTVEEVVIFGSRAKGTHRPGSDVDLALKEKIDRSTVAQISDLLNEESTMPYTFDLVVYDTIVSQNLKEHITRVGAVLYSAVEFALQKSSHQWCDKRTTPQVS